MKRWQSENKQAVKAKKAIAYLKDKKRNQEKRKAYYQANRDKWNASARRRALADPGREKAKMKAWYQKNREKQYERNRIAFRENPKIRAYMTAAARRRRAKLQGVPVTISAKEMREIALATKECYYCLETERKLTWDHKEPLHLGGSHSRENLVRACARCNYSKGCLPLHEWIFSGRDFVPVRMLAEGFLEIIRCATAVFEMESRFELAYFCA